MIELHRSAARVLAAIATILLVSIAVFQITGSRQVKPESRIDPLVFSALAGVSRPIELKNEVEFPRDHGAHHESNQESWQFFGFFRTKSNFGFYLHTNFFRFQLGGQQTERRSAWVSHQLFTNWFSFIPQEDSIHYSKFESSRGALGLAGFDDRQRKLWVYRKQMNIFENHPDGKLFQLKLPDPRYSMELNFSPLKKSVVLDGSAAFRYYGISRMQASGSLRSSDNNQPLSGTAFFDHGWGNLPLGSGQLIRNRFVLLLSNQVEFILLQTARRDGSGIPINSGIMVLSDSEVVQLQPNEIELTALRYQNNDGSGIRYPVAWEIRIPERSVAIQMETLSQDQKASLWMSNWSGPVKVSSNYENTSISGFGLVQLAGYSPVQ